MKRLKAWNDASELVEPIVEKHGLNQISPGGNMFGNGPAILTPVDQHIEHIFTVAEWLMKEEDDA